MANQISVNSGTGNITVTTSRSVIGTVANVASANVANTVLNNAQPNITSVGTLNSLAISGDITTVDSITLDTAATEAYAAAKMWWSVSDGTFNMGMYNNVTQQVGQELFFYGKAQGNIVDGQSVMFAGVQGNHILMQAADASVPGFRKEFLIGIATQNITNGSFGYVTWFGKINGVDTRGFPTGSLLWFDPTTVGGLTNVEPTGNNIKVLMAAVIKAETSPAANNGVLLVRPTFEPNINDIQGVKVTTPSNGQVLTYDSANSVWVNANVTANVSNVAYAANAGNANFANTAAVANVANVSYSVSGANVSGSVANANYATNAGTATVAQSANSVTLANVSGAGNIASINLDGSASNILYGNGTFAPAAAVTSANYANFAGNAFSVDGANVIGEVANAAYSNTAGQAFYVDGVDVNGAVANAVYADDAASAGSASIAYSVDGANVSGQVANALVAGTVTTNAQPNITSVGTLANLNVTGTGAFGNQISVTRTDPQTASELLLTVYGDGAQGEQLILTRRRNGNTSARQGVNANDYLGNIEWQGASTSTGGGFTTAAKIAPKVDSAYPGPSTSAAVPIGFEVEVVDVNDNSYTHSFYSNGNVQFGGAISATNLGNIASINLDGNASNLLDGTGNWVAIPAAANANFANFAGTVTNSAQPNITSLGRVTDFQTANGLSNFVNEPYASPIIWTFAYGDGDGGQILSSIRRRNGNSAARLGLNAGDYLGNLEWQGASTSTGGGFATAAKIAPRVDNSYTGPSTTDAAPIGIEFQVVDSTDTAYLHTFYANGNVQFNNAVNANIVSANYLYGDGSNISNISAGTPNSIQNGTSVVDFSGTNGDLRISTNGVFNGVTVSGRSVILNGVGEQPPANGVFSSLNINNGGVSINQDNIGGGLATFAFTQYENTTSYLNPYTFYRTRGNASSPQAVANGDSIMSQSFFCYGDSGNTYVSMGTIGASVKTNDLAGNVSAGISIATARDNDGSDISLFTDNINLNGNTKITGTNRFMQLSVYTATQLNAITGQMGQIATVSDSTPNGMMAYWDNTNGRWSYVHDNSAV